MGGARKNLLVLLAGLLLAGIHITGLGGSMAVNLREGKNDFAQLYMGARLAGTGRLYDPAPQFEWQRSRWGSYMPAVTFVRLPFYAVLLKPLHWLEYRTAWALFLLANFLCALWFFSKFLWPDFPAFLLGAAFLPVYAALANGQDVWFVAALFGLAVLLARQGCELAAGAILSVCSIKPHLFVFVPVVLLIHRKWRILAGGVAGAAAQVAISAVFEGWDWVGRFLTAIGDPRVHPRAEVMPTLRGMTEMTGAPPWLFWLLAGMVAGGVVLAAIRCRSTEVALAAALAGGLLANYHAYLPDAVLLLVAFVLLRRQGLAGMPLWLFVLLVSPLPCLLFLYGPPLAYLLPAAMVGALAGVLLWPPAACAGGATEQTAPAQRGS